MFWPCQNANQFGLRVTQPFSQRTEVNNLPFDHTAIIPSQVLKYTARKPVLKNIFIISARTEQLHTGAARSNLAKSSRPACFLLSAHAKVHFGAD
jgi:hypothetical protein